MFRFSWRVRLIVYAVFITAGTVYAFFSMHAPASAQQLIDPTALNQSFQINPGYANHPNGANLPDPDLLNNITNNLSSIQNQMQTYAERLFVLLVGLDLFWMTAQFILTKDNLGEFFAQVTTKFVTVIFIYYVVIQHGGELATVIIGSFTTAASNVNLPNNYDTNVTPTGLIAEGAGFASAAIAEAIGVDLIPDEILGNGATNLSTAASEMLTGAAFAIFAVYSGIAAEVAVATLEVYVVLNLGIIVTGFLGSRWTERYGQGFVSFAIHAGVKFLFVQIMIGLIHAYLTPLASTMLIPVAGPAIFAAIALFCAALLHAVPNFAASAMSGTSNSSGAQLAGAMSQAFGSVGAIAKAGSSFGKENAASRRNEEAGKRQEQSEMASFANKAMMREEAGDKVRQRATDAQQAPASPAFGRGVGQSKIGDQRGQSWNRTTPTPSGAAVNGAAAGGSLAGKSNGSVGAKSANGALAGTPPSALSASTNGAKGLPAAQSGANAAASLQSAKQPSFGAKVVGNDGASASVPGLSGADGSNGGASLGGPSSATSMGSVPPTALSASTLGSTDAASGGGFGPSAIGTGAGAVPIGIGSSLPGDGAQSIGGFAQPSLQDALTAPPPVPVGLPPQQLGVPDAPVTPLGGSASPASSSSAASANAPSNAPLLAGEAAALATAASTSPPTALSAAPMAPIMQPAASAPKVKPLPKPPAQPGSPPSSATTSTQPQQSPTAPPMRPSGAVAPAPPSIPMQSGSQPVASPNPAQAVSPPTLSRAAVPPPSVRPAPPGPGPRPPQPQAPNTNAAPAPTDASLPSGPPQRPAGAVPPRRIEP